MIAQVIDQLIVAYTFQAAMGWISGGSSSSNSGQSFAVPSYRPSGFDGGGYTGHGGKYEPAGLSTAANSFSPKRQPAASA